MVKFVTGLADRLVTGLVPRISAAASSNDCFEDLQCTLLFSTVCTLTGDDTLQTRQCCVDASGTFCSAWENLGCCP